MLPKPAATATGSLGWMPSTSTVLDVCVKPMMDSALTSGVPRALVPLSAARTHTMATAPSVPPADSERLHHRCPGCAAGPYSRLGVRSQFQWLRTPLSSAVIQTAFVPLRALTQLGELSSDRRALYGTVL